MINNHLNQNNKLKFDISRILLISFGLLSHQSSKSIKLLNSKNK